MAWSKERTDVGGFLAPDLEGKRFLLTLRDRQIHPFQVEESEVNGQTLVSICRYQFLPAAFALAQEVLLEDARRGVAWLIVDEVGKLELQGQGHDAALREVLERCRTGAYSGRLLLVVRSELLSEVVKRYDLHGAHVLDSPEALAAAG